MWNGARAGSHAPRRRTKKKNANLFSADTPIVQPKGTTAIERLRCLDRVLTDAPVVGGHDAAVDVAAWRVVQLRFDYGEGGSVEADPARGPDWLAEHHSEVGSSIWLDIQEMGCVGEATVLGIDPVRSRSRARDDWCSACTGTVQA